MPLSISGTSLGTGKHCHGKLYGKPQVTSISRGTSEPQDKFELPPLLPSILAIGPSNQVLALGSQHNGLEAYHNNDEQ